MAKKLYDMNEKPEELMTTEERDKYYKKKLGMSHSEFIKQVKPLTDEEKREYGLIK